jgi:hypothetical protein
VKLHRDVAQANRMRWFLAAHLLAVLGIFEASLWVGEHLATKPDPIPAASAMQASTMEQRQPQRLARDDGLAGRMGDGSDEHRWHPTAHREAADGVRVSDSGVTHQP